MMGFLQEMVGFYQKFAWLSTCQDRWFGQVLIAYFNIGGEAELGGIGGNSGTF